MNRYRLTKQGKNLLNHPVSLHDLDQALLHVVSLILGTRSDIENQLLGIDLVREGEMRHRVELSAGLAWKKKTCQVTMEWEKNEERPIHPTKVKIS